MPAEWDPFERLADDIEALWRREAYAEASFARIAMRALRAHSLAERSGRSADLAGLGAGAAGSSGAVLAARERFAVRLDATPSSTQVHSHDHAGAFCVLRGSSLHATYRWAAR